MKFKKSLGNCFCRAGPGRAGPGRAGPGLVMQRAETGRALNTIRARGPQRAGPWGQRAGPGRTGPGRAVRIRPVQISARVPSVFSGYIWLDTQSVSNRLFQNITEWKDNQLNNTCIIIYYYYCSATIIKLFQRVSQLRTQSTQLTMSRQLLQSILQSWSLVHVSNLKESRFWI